MRKPQILRLFRFSLASFLLAITIFCVWLGIQVNRVRRQESAVAWVEEAGGRVAYGYQRDTKGDWTGHWDKGGDWAWDAEPHGPKWLRELIGDKYFLTVVEVDLRGSKATDLSPLTDMPDVEWLFARSTNITDISPLAHLPNLRYLALTDAPVTDLSPLQESNSLVSLDINNTRVRDLSPLARMTNLERLTMYGTPASEEEIAKLRTALPDCKIVVVDDPRHR